MKQLNNEFWVLLYVSQSGITVSMFMVMLTLSTGKIYMVIAMQVVPGKHSDTFASELQEHCIRCYMLSNISNMFKS